MTFRVMIGDCVEQMRTLPDASVDSCVTDPPYGISFMSKGWDKSVPSPDVWREVLRVLKPGGHLLAFAGTRTQHRMACAIEDSGFEIRDMIAWTYGSGFPKSHNLDGDWQGWGTALKPAMEPITVARKPLIGTVASNVMAHGTGALNIDGCRVDGDNPMTWTNPRGGIWKTDSEARAELIPSRKGRWPANLIHDGSDEVLASFPDAKGQQGFVGKKHGDRPSINTYGDWGPRPNTPPRNDTGSAARFFYCAKTSKSERNDGDVDNNHPTVKPTDLMRYLCRLVTPPGGVVLDPFMGSGSTGRGAVLEGFDFIGMEIDKDYAEMAEKRIAAVISDPLSPYTKGNWT